MFYIKHSEDNNKNVYSSYDCWYNTCPIYKGIINDDYVLLEEKQPEFNRVDLLIYAFDLNSKILEIASALRKEGVNVIVDYKNKKLKKALEQANSLKIPFVAIIGEDEIKENKIALKNMKDGTQVSLSILEAAKLIIKERKNG